MASRGVVLLLVLVAAIHLSHGLKILSFNIENFSVKKYSKQPVVDVLLKVVKNYDLVLLLEMEDSNGEVLQGLVDQLNSNWGGNFDGIKSKPLKASTSRGRPEEYAFIYRKDKVDVEDTYQSRSRSFSRPPFSVLLKAKEIGLTFFMVPVHTKPKNTFAEINALPAVFTSAAGHFDTHAGVILGDLNCGCEFLSNTKYNQLKLVKAKSFHWWIDNNAGTTSKKGHACPFDRIITHDGLTEHVVAGSAHVVRFDQELGLSYNMTRQVSDHFPVTFTLK